MSKEYYRIVRMFQGNYPSETITSGLTLEEAQAWCRDPETSSTTATSAEALELTERVGAWFDGYESQDR
jgi:hypothetical protein